jgi:hypothetical protein
LLLIPIRAPSKCWRDVQHDRVAPGWGDAARLGRDAAGDASQLGFLAGCYSEAELTGAGYPVDHVLGFKVVPIYGAAGPIPVLAEPFGYEGR